MYVCYRKHPCSSGTHTDQLGYQAEYDSVP